jgi:hypothetical protein
VIDLYEELASVIKELRSEAVQHALVGALAVAVHGVPRATKVLDILVRKEDEAALRRAVRRAGYVLEALPMEFASGVEMQRFTKLIGGRPLMLDILWAKGPLLPIWERREKFAWREGEIDVVSRDDLITLKLTAGRP